MTFSVKMPALGESVTEGTVTPWLKAEGDSVALIIHVHGEVFQPALSVLHPSPRRALGVRE